MKKVCFEIVRKSAFSDELKVISRVVVDPNGADNLEHQMEIQVWSMNSESPFFSHYVRRNDVEVEEGS